MLTSPACSLKVRRQLATETQTQMIVGAESCQMPTSVTWLTQQNGHTNLPELLTGKVTADTWAHTLPHATAHVTKVGL